VSLGVRQVTAETVNPEFDPAIGGQWRGGSMVVMITITPHLFEAYLKCPTKSFLRSLGETGSGNPYADWVSTRNALYARDGIRRLRENIADNQCIAGAERIERTGLKSGTWQLATEMKVGANSLECTLHALERVPNGIAGKSAQLIPTRFIRANKLSRHDRLLVAFDALVLSEMLGREVELAKIIHGDRSVTLRVRTTELIGEVRKKIAKIAVLLSGQTSPDLVLNRHCAECEFQKRCRQKAIEEDDLSLLAGVSEIERARYRSKGIFTVKQLSYTFRPRRTPKRTKNPARPRYPALQALALRENTVYVHGSPTFPNSKTQVYLDIEGSPDSDSYYLIGTLIVSEGQEAFHSFWADNPAEEPEAFSKFIDAINQLDDFRVLHFGQYEIAALRRMKSKLPERLHPRIDTILEHAINVLSIIHSYIYFPTYSNALKDIGRFLGFQRTDDEATGLQSIIWRNTWNENRAKEIKARLLQYNQDDCRELKYVTDFLMQVISPGTSAPTSFPKIQTLFKIVPTGELVTATPRWELFRAREYALEDLAKVVKCSYFDYQREKVLVRTHPQMGARIRKRRTASIRVNTVTVVKGDRCPVCRSKKIDPVKQMSHVEVDLKFFKGGVKKWVTRIISWRYRCSRCKHEFSSEKRAPNPRKYGHGLVSWCVYCNVAGGVNISRTEGIVADVFGLTLPNGNAPNWKRYIVGFYEPLYAEIRASILTSPVIHIDETTVKLRNNRRGYVWVMTSLEKVYYFYKPSREGSFLRELLGNFSGVLVSDFFTAYDSLKCEQQKCLVHLVRDIDDDVMKNPLDMELASMARGFGTLLRGIIETVDIRGLKRRYLRKHKRLSRRFLKSVASSELTSPMANKYKKRFEKSGEKLFTFLDHDGVPWNNNNAEHAIKRFAKYRRDADGRFTERTLEEYLVLASVFETCEFSNVNVLQFLLSKGATLEGLLGMAGR
jgi:predicted RecB family nuclease